MMGWRERVWHVLVWIRCAWSGHLEQQIDWREDSFWCDGEQVKQWRCTCRNCGGVWYEDMES